MDETSSTGPGSPSPDSQSPIGVPVAIVIAGGLIAAALYYGGGGSAGGARLVDNGAAPDAAAPAVAPVAAPGPAGAAVGDMRPVNNEDHVRGAANAKVTLVEYSDLECPFCKRFHPTVQQLLEEYPNDVRWVYRHFPLEQLHSQAPKEAEATECAAEQGKFWEMVDLIYKVTPSNDGLNLDQLPVFAEQAGVANIAQFEACLESGKYADKVAADLADAAAAGGQGTPYSVLIGPDGTKVPVSGAQPYASVKAAVEQLL
jgi:protein-disulfide isomerase